jgi:hypothetical protein
VHGGPSLFPVTISALPQAHQGSTLDAAPMPRLSEQRLPAARKLECTGPTSSYAALPLGHSTVVTVMQAPTLMNSPPQFLMCMW